MLKLWSFIFLLLTSMAIQANPIFSSGDIKFTGDAYISTLSPVETKGIGRITTITQGDHVLWSSGDSGNFINFVFGNYSPVVSPSSPVFNFEASGGYVDFFLNSAGTFNTLLDINSEMTAIQSGNLLLSTIGKGPTIGISTPVSYSANGFLDVTGGLFNWLLDTNSLPTFASNVFADLSFGLVGVNNKSSLVSKDYQIIASADMQGSTSISQVPLPSAIWSLLSGLIAFLAMNKQRKFG